MKYVDYVVDQINVLQKKYTYKNVFKDYLTMVANWNCDVHRFEDGVSFDDVVEEYAVKIMTKCMILLLKNSHKKRSHQLNNWRHLSNTFLDTLIIAYVFENV